MTPISGMAVPTGLSPIAVNAAVIGPRPTGLGLYALSLIKALGQLGRERLLVYSSRPELVDGPGLDVRSIAWALGPEGGARSHLARLVWTQIALRARLRREGAGLLLNAMPEGLLRPALPQVTMIHDVVPLLYPADYPKQQGYFRRYVRAVLRASRAVVVSSASTRRDLLSVFPELDADRLHVVLGGCDTQRFTADGPAAAPGETPYALCVGNVMPHKNLERLLEAFARARRSAAFHLVIRGSGKRRRVDAVRRRIEALGIAPFVDWQAYVPADELVRLYRGARVLVVPSLHEGFGLTALEAMACGTPVVASDRSSLPEVVGDAGLLVDPLDVGALADAIVRVVGDDRLAKDLRERGLARAAAFSWESTARGVHDVMDRARRDATAEGARC